MCIYLHLLVLRLQARALGLAGAQGLVAARAARRELLGERLLSPQLRLEDLGFHKQGFWKQRFSRELKNV